MQKLKKTFLKKIMELTTQKIKNQKKGFFGKIENVISYYEIIYTISITMGALISLFVGMATNFWICLMIYLTFMVLLTKGLHISYKKRIKKIESMIQEENIDLFNDEIKQGLYRLHKTNRDTFSYKMFNSILNTPVSQEFAEEIIELMKKTISEKEVEGILNSDLSINYLKGNDIDIDYLMRIIEMSENIHIKNQKIKIFDKKNEKENINCKIKEKVLS